ncbi:MAG: fibronectin type III domain-containing protein, partial [Spirochaetaceae bacterium]|nr:fibronectin type III domain-containing protein [Spirochaetaceae bacterium]
TVAGLSNGTAYDVQLRARSGAGPGAASATVVVTPRAGICARSPAVSNAIVAKLAGVTTCAKVTPADLVSVTGALRLRNQEMTAVRRGDFAGLSRVTALDLSFNGLQALPAGIFDDLRALTSLDLSFNRISALPSGVFDHATELRSLDLSSNRLTALPHGVFRPLGALTDLDLGVNRLRTLLPGLFEGLQGQGLTAMALDSNPGDAITWYHGGSFTLTLALVQDGQDGFRVGIEQGAPFPIDVEVRIHGGAAVDGTQPDGTVALPAGARTSARVAVSADDPATAPVVSIAAASFAAALPAPQRPALPFPDSRWEHLYDGTLIRLTDDFPGLLVALGEPLVLREVPARPAEVTASPGDRSLLVAWADPDDPSISGYQIQFRDQGGRWQEWTDLAGSGARTVSHALTGLTNETAYEVRVRARNANGAGVASAAVAATPRGGICLRTPMVRDAVLGALAARGRPGACAQVTATHLASLAGSLDLSGQEIAALQAGDFAGLGALTGLDLSGNALAALPDGLLAGLTALTELDLSGNALSALPDGLLAGLTALTDLHLDGNDVKFLHADAFAGLAALTRLNLADNRLQALPGGLFSGLRAVTALDLSGNPGAPFGLNLLIERVAGEDSIRARVVEGAPFAIDAAFTVANGGAATSTLTVARGSVEGAAVALTRDAPDSAPVVTVAAPAVPAGYAGVLVDLRGSPLVLGAVPAGLAEVFAYGDPLDGGEVVIGWDSPGDPGITALQARFRHVKAISTDTGTVIRKGSWSAWTTLSSAPEQTRVTFKLAQIRTLLSLPPITLLPADADGTYEVQVRASNAVGAGTASRAVPFTVRTGICARSPGVQRAILAYLEQARGRSYACSGVGAAELSGIDALDLAGRLDGDAVKPGDFDGLSGLETLSLGQNPVLETLPSALFADLASLTRLDLQGNGLRVLPADVFQGVPALTHLDLADNRLTALPPGLFAGLTRLLGVAVDDNPGAPFTLTMALEQAGRDSFRVRVVEGAPLLMDATFWIANGAPDVGTAEVAAGATTSAAIDVTRHAYVPPVITLGTPPDPGQGHAGGYRGIRTAVSPPLTLAPAPAAPAGLIASGGDRTIVLTWDDPGDASIHRYEVQVGSDPRPWEAIAGSDAGTVVHRLTGLANDVAHEVRLRAVNVVGPGQASTARAVPLAGVCGRTREVRTALIGLLDGVTECGQVTAADLAAIDGTVDLSARGLAAVRAGDFDGLTALTRLDLGGNELGALPAGAFDALAALSELDLSGNLLTALPAGMFGRLGKLNTLGLAANELTALPAGAFDGLGSLTALTLDGNGGAPFTLAMTLQQVGLETVRLRVAEGAPYEMDALVAIDLGSGPVPETRSIPRGAVNGGIFRAPWAAPSTPPAITITAVTAPPPGYTGLRVTGNGASLTLVTTPAAPADLAATAGDGSLTLTWSDPGDHSVSRYQTRVRAAGGPGWRAWADIAGSGPATVTHTVVELVNG